MDNRLQLVSKQEVKEHDKSSTSGYNMGLPHNTTFPGLVVKENT